MQVPEHGGGRARHRDHSEARAAAALDRKVIFLQAALLDMDNRSIPNEIERPAGKWLYAPWLVGSRSPPTGPGWPRTRPGR